jgi:hypothetical protein
MNFEELSAYKPLPDFFGATADVVEFGVTEVPSTWIFIDITISTKDLYTFLCIFNGCF